MSYFCEYDCNDNSYIFLLLDYTIRLGNVIGFFYFLINSQYFNEFFKNVLHGGNREWIKIEERKYNIINIDSSESDSENQQEEEEKSQNEKERPQEEEEGQQ